MIARPAQLPALADRLRATEFDLAAPSLTAAERHELAGLVQETPAMVGLFTAGCPDRHIVVPDVMTAVAIASRLDPDMLEPSIDWLARITGTERAIIAAAIDRAPADPPFDAVFVDFVRAMGPSRRLTCPRCGRTMG